MQYDEEKLFYETFSNIQCLIRLGYEEKEFEVKKWEDKFSSVSYKLIYISKNRKVSILYFEGEEHISFYIGNINDVYLEKPKWEQNSFCVEEWLEVHKYADKDIFSFDKNTTDLKANFELIKKRFEEVCQIKELKKILKGEDWWEEPLFTFYNY